MIDPTRRRGLSEAYGSWKTICISRRNGRSFRRDQCVMSCPSSSMRPPVGSSSRVTSRATVDFPQPVSPTRPSVSAGAIVNETPSTA